MALQIVVCLVLGYIVGSFSTGYIMGLMNHVDIREMGSGNAGTTNAFRTLGKKAGIITLIGDMLKAILVVLLIRFVIYKDIDYVKLLELICGFGCVLGHNFPVWLKFHGGKGIAVTAGVFIAIDPWILPVGLPLFAILVLTTKYVSVCRFSCSTYFIPYMECDKVFFGALLCLDNHSVMYVYCYGFYPAQTEYKETNEWYGK